MHMHGDHSIVAEVGERLRPSVVRRSELRQIDHCDLPRQRQVDRSHSQIDQRSWVAQNQESPSKTAPPSRQ